MRAEAAPCTDLIDLGLDLVSDAADVLECIAAARLGKIAQQPPNVSGVWAEVGHDCANGPSHLLLGLFDGPHLCRQLQSSEKTRSGASQPASASPQSAVRSPAKPA